MVVEYRLVKDRILSDSDYAKLLLESEFDRYLEKAKHWLLFAPRSIRATREYLEKAGADKETAEKAMEKLIRTGLLDDVAKASDLANFLAEEKRFGPKRIIFELTRKGFSLELAGKAATNLPDEITKSNLDYLFNRKIRSLKKGSINQAKSTMRAFLARKGYDLDTINMFVADRKSEFTDFIDEKKQIARDYGILKAKYAKSELSEIEKQEKTIEALSRKGYSYQLIKDTIERG